MMLETSTGSASSSPPSTPRSPRRPPRSPARWPSSVRSPGRRHRRPRADRRGRHRHGSLPSHAHLVWWAKFCPRSTSRPARPSPRAAAGQPWLAGTLGNIVPPLPRTGRFLKGRDRRIAKRRGKQKAMRATGNSVLVIVDNLLGDAEARFSDLGADHDDARSNKHRRARNLAAQLQAVTGQRIMIWNGRAVIVEPEAGSPISGWPAQPSDDHRMGTHCRLPPTAGFRVRHRQSR